MTIKVTILSVGAEPVWEVWQRLSDQTASCPTCTWLSAVGLHGHFMKIHVGA